MKMKLVTTLAVITSLVLSSCSSTSSGFAANTPDELKTMKQSRLAHGAGGALLGAGLGYLLTKNQSSSQRLTGILGGAAAGGFLGDMLGQKKGQQRVGQKRVAKATEAQLKTAIGQADKFNGALTKYNSRLSREIVQLRKTPNKKEVSVSLKHANTATKQAREQLKATQQFLADPANSAGKSRMQNRENTLKKNINKLEKNRSELTKLSKLSKA